MCHIYMDGIRIGVDQKRTEMFSYSLPYLLNTEFLARARTRPTVQHPSEPHVSLSGSSRNIGIHRHTQTFM